MNYYTCDLRFIKPTWPWLVRLLAGKKNNNKTNSSRREKITMNTSRTLASRHRYRVLYIYASRGYGHVRTMEGGRLLGRMPDASKKGKTSKSLFIAKYHSSTYKDFVLSWRKPPQRVAINGANVCRGFETGFSRSRVRHSTADPPWTPVMGKHLCYTIDYGYTRQWTQHVYSAISHCPTSTFPH